MAKKHIFLTKEAKGRKLIKPTFEDDLAIFQHCADGMINVIPEYYETKMKSVLFLHGYVGLIRAEDNDKN